MATEVAADSLGEEQKGYVVWSESVVGMTSRVSFWSKLSWSMDESACYKIRGNPITDQEGPEKESTNLHQVAS